MELVVKKYPHLVRVTISCEMELRENHGIGRTTTLGFIRIGDPEHNTLEGLRLLFDDKMLQWQEEAERLAREHETRQKPKPKFRFPPRKG